MQPSAFIRVTPMNTEPRFPIHRLAIRVGLVAEAPAPYPRRVRGPQDIFDLGDDARTWDRERFVLSRSTAATEFSASKRYRSGA